MLSDRTGLPLTVGISAVNTHDSRALKPLVNAIPAVRSRRGPRRRKPAKLHADKAYDIPALPTGSASTGSSRASPAKASNPATNSANTGG